MCDKNKRQERRSTTCEFGIFAIFFSFCSVNAIYMMNDGMRRAEYAYYNKRQNTKENIIVE